MKPPQALVYLGPAGSYSEMMALQLMQRFRVKTLIPEFSLEAVAENIKEGTWGVMAYRDSLEGLLHECLDLLCEYQLQTAAAFRLPITPSAGAFPGTLGKEGLDSYSGDIHSHRRTFRLCRQWLDNNCPKARRVNVYSTSQAPAIVATNRQGVAIAEVSALRKNGLEVVQRDIASGATDFFLAAPHAENQEEQIENLPAGNYKTMIAIAPREIGKSDFYNNIARLMANHRLEISDRTGRPARIDDSQNSTAEFNPEEMQLFYFEVNAHKTDPKLEAFLNAAKFLPVGELRIMGSYKNTWKSEEKPSSSIMICRQNPPTSA